MVLLNRSVALFLVANTLLGVLWQPLVYADFKLRQEYIAEVLCIEKEKSITVCYGNCVLTQRLRQVENSQEQNRSQTSQNRLLEITFFKIKGEVEMPVFNSSALMAPTHFEYRFQLSKGHTLDVFNPPQQA